MQLGVVCVLAFAAVMALVGSAVILHPGRSVIGLNPSDDFQIMTWSLAWWPWALRHGVDPLHTRLLWPPAGFSTLWMTTIPAAAALAAPVTLTAGPLVAYNVLMMLAVPLASGAAYLLCRELSGRVLPALAGGLLFGLSPYMLGHLLSQHLNLVLVFPLPLVGLVCVRYVRSKTDPVRSVCLLALLLALGLGFSLELFVDLTLFLALGCLLALAGGIGGRRHLLRLSGLVALSYAVLLPLLVPIAMLGLGHSHGALIYAPQSYAIDLANLIVPTPTLLVGLLHGTRAISVHFVGNIGEQDGYLGLPLVAAALVALVWQWRRGAWLVGALLACAVLFSFGPILTLAGRPLLRLPFALAHLPVFSQALPARFSIFSALGASVLAALLLGRLRHRWLQLAVAVLLIASLAPNFWPAGRLPGAWAVSDEFGYITSAVPNGFLHDPIWRWLVPPGSTLLVLPTQDATAASWWQAESGMRFALAVPETPSVPPALATEPVVQGLLSGRLPQADGAVLAAARLRAYLRADHVAVVALTHRALKTWRRTVAYATHAKAVTLDGIAFYRVRASLPPLRVGGRVLVRRARGDLLVARLAFDGHRARVRVAFRAGLRPMKVAVMSPAAADADSLVAALGPRERGAVAFTQALSGQVAVRVATRVAGHWRLVTLERRSEPISGLRILALKDGAIALVWVDQAGPLAILRAAAQDPGRQWRIVTLDATPDLEDVTLHALGGRALVAFVDNAANLSELHLTAFAAGRWTVSTTVATGSWPLDDLRFAAGARSSLTWWAIPAAANPQHFMATARRTGWTVRLVTNRRSKIRAQHLRHAHAHHSRRHAQRAKLCLSARQPAAPHGLRVK